MSLKGKIALVTGASRGIGRGIALQLGEAGATVYITGRKPALSLQAEHSDLPTLERTAAEINERGGKGIPVYVDHAEMTEVKQLFEQLELETDGQLDILVNNAFSAIGLVEQMVDKKFWELEPELWDDFNNVGLRNHYFCSVYAARLMARNRSGLIANVSSMGGLRYLFGVAYGVGKTALDRMAADMAYELRDQGVAAVSLWPGAVSTEMFRKIADSGVLERSADPLTGSIASLMADAESPEFTGIALVHLANDPNLMKRTGRTLLVADLAIDYRFTDVNGKQPPSIRSMRTIFAHFGFANVGGYLPGWLRVPGWLLTAVSSRL